MLNNKHRLKAFTLIELLVCVLIISVLIAIAVPLYLKHLEKAKGSEALENLSLIRSAEMLYQPEHSGFTNDSAVLQTYTNFSLDDGDWQYSITSSADDNFTATATRTSPNSDYNDKTITIDQKSDIMIDGISVVDGGSWPPN